MAPGLPVRSPETAAFVVPPGTVIDGFKVVVHLPGVKRDDITVAARPGSLAFEIATRWV